MNKLNKLGHLRAVWDDIVTSLWFVPGIMMIGAVPLSILGFWTDWRLGSRDPDEMPWWIYVAKSDAARELVSTLLSSMITMTSLVFSITMVVLTLAANQFGPRLVRSFMSSTMTQMVLGTFMMTIFYCLLVLASIGRRSSDAPVPYSGISLAIFLMAASLVLLVVFIHTLARSIVAETVIDRVGSEFDDGVDRLAPASQDAQTPPEDQLPNNFEALSAYFGSAEAGYVQAIGFARLIQVAEEADVVIGLYFRAGDYVAEGGRTVAVYPASRCNAELINRVHHTITTGIDRTPVQDIEFALRHLVEIAVRALSPGINDPYTAVAVLHRLSASLSRSMGKALPEGLFRSDGGAVRIICPQPTYAGLINGAFDQIRQNGADKPLVVIHLLEAMVRIAEHTILPAQLEALREQLGAVIEATERRIASPSDQADVRQRSEKVRRALERASERILQETADAQRRQGC